MRYPKALFLAFMLSACTTKLQDQSPTSPSTPAPSAPSPTPVPVPVVVVPVPVPEPVPGPPTAPAPPTTSPSSPNSPTTPSNPPPPPSSGGGSCSLPASHDSGCSRTSESFLGDVEAAIDQLVREQPSLFNLHNTQGCSTCYEVLNPS